MKDLHHSARCRFRPTPEQVADLIERACGHELGLEFLRKGAPDAVAAAFGVHAFTVDAARRQLEEKEGTAGA
jgi:hypothetical protein